MSFTANKLRTGSQRLSRLMDPCARPCGTFGYQGVVRSEGTLAVRECDNLV